MNLHHNTPDPATTLYRKLSLLIDLRKRHAFDFLASLPDMDLYGPRASNRVFDEEELNLDLSNEWNMDSQDFDHIQRDRTPGETHKKKTFLEKTRASRFSRIRSVFGTRMEIRFH
jgi:hypothetical protein